ncbi:hypothetical protein EMIHUDRAFT_245501 [Emiliania huxleyi CCMP1516]|uniref:Peptidase A1 domain-containing protein n=2 Tax=Emiliania huxleyi TaxID=2903 RepID=A0A0D3IX73_EMIH1|nr:hypothetical protein EMIHUDRAFT_245501 [Emiliania huxleyi CCMP1516]EOD15858.1 hypothetical protein EMIHUDRAFT_245501 [Emiliania huxleyi CCMP1516]|eukprot:XP_005768287.1 hypothetical protein EMIHUDRAFT_245501 [Emiliania huxleyi CCMP1516]
MAVSRSIFTAILGAGASDTGILQDTAGYCWILLDTGNSWKAFPANVDTGYWDTGILRTGLGHKCRKWAVVMAGVMTAPGAGECSRASDIVGRSGRVGRAAAPTPVGSLETVRRQAKRSVGYQSLLCGGIASTLVLLRAGAKLQLPRLTLHHNVDIACGYCRILQDTAGYWPSLMRILGYSAGLEDQLCDIGILRRRGWITVILTGGIFYSIPVFEACCEVSQYLVRLREVEVRKYSNSPCLLRLGRRREWRAPCARRHRASNVIDRAACCVDAFFWLSSRAFCVPAGGRICVV